MDLASQKCVPCEIGGEPLDSAAISVHRALIEPSWEVVNEKKLKRQFKFKDFRTAMEFINDVAQLAESENHHPDLYIFYNLVTIELWTHAVGGLSLNDFIVAKKIEPLAHAHNSRAV